MRTFRSLSMSFILIAVLVLAAVPAFAQESKTMTITEDRINESYRVTNPIRRSLSDVSIDLQPGQIVQTATYTRRGQNTAQVVSTFVPSVSNGRIYWSVSSVTTDGEAISESLLDQINTSIESSWRRYFKEQRAPGRVTSVEITDTEIIISYTGLS
jgi:predicted PurR-regulated permease PerM